jgi:hypothetical protein
MQRLCECECRPITAELVEHLQTCQRPLNYRGCLSWQFILDRYPLERLRHIYRMVGYSGDDFCRRLFTLPEKLFRRIAQYYEKSCEVCTEFWVKLQRHTMPGYRTVVDDSTYSREILFGCTLDNCHFAPYCKMIRNAYTVQLYLQKLNSDCTCRGRCGSQTCRKTLDLFENLEKDFRNEKVMDKKERVFLQKLLRMHARQCISSNCQVMHCTRVKSTLLSEQYRKYYYCEHCQETEVGRIEADENLTELFLDLFHRMIAPT